MSQRIQNFYNIHQRFRRAVTLTSAGIFGALGLYYGGPIGGLISTGVGAVIGRFPYYVVRGFERPRQTYDNVNNWFDITAPNGGLFNINALVPNGNQRVNFARAPNTFSQWLQANYFLTPQQAASYAADLVNLYNQDSRRERRSPAERIGRTATNPTVGKRIGER